MTPQPFLHTTPGELLGDTLRQTVSIALVDGQTRQFQVVLPTSIDTLLDHPTTHTAFAADEYMPYWAELWPAALMLGRRLAQRTWTSNPKALEVGCGVGFAGLVALALGMEVIFSDYDVAALDFAARNARLNGFTRFQTLPLDWRHPPKGLKVPLILAADVIYETRNITPLLQLIKALLSADGEFWLADPDRPQKEAFQQALYEQNFGFEAMKTVLERPEQPTVRGTVYRIWRVN
ncbi:MAG: methyltransferase domain-containing protein [Cyanobacteria bacterium P01_D01_bin.156]